VCVIGASDRQPCASNTAPNGAAFEDTTLRAFAMYSSQVFGALVGSRPAFSTMSPFHAWTMMSSRNGNAHIFPSNIASCLIEGIRSATTDFEMYLSHGSITPASISAAISTKGVIPT
jgi:hypothetical protein